MRLLPDSSANNIPAAIGIMLGGMFLVAGMDTVAKILSATLPLAMIVWARFVFHTLWLSPAIIYWARKNPQALRDERHNIVGHFVRGILIALSTVFYFAAIRDNPIPDAIAVFFVEPIFVMFLAAAFLRERLRRRRLIAAFIAFGGVLIVLRPGGGHYEPSIFFALLAGLSFAGYIVATRASSVRGSPLLTAWGTALAAAICATPTALWAWQMPTTEWGLLIFLGALAAGGHLGITYACRFADASLIAIFHYSEIIIAAVITYFVFDNYIADKWVWAGFALIAGAKIGVTLLEYQERRADNQH